MECLPQTLQPSLNLRLTSLSCATTTSKISLLSSIKPKTRRRTHQLSPIPLFVFPTRNPLNKSPLHAPHADLATSESQSSLGVGSETAEWAMQDFYALRKDVETAAERVEEIRTSAGLERLEAERALLEKKAADSSLWDDPPKAQETLLALTDVKDKIKLLDGFKTQVEEAGTIVKLTEELDSIDTGLLEEVTKIIRELTKALDRFELTQLLSGPYDKEGAVVTISAGAGAQMHSAGLG